MEPKKQIPTKDAVAVVVPALLSDRPLISNTIHIPIKRKWFDMILSGKKKEEYRAIKEYWWKRLLTNSSASACAYYLGAEKIETFQGYGVAPKYGNDTTITFTAGYGKDKPKMVVELKWIDIKSPNPEWCPPETEGLWFALKLGSILETNNIITQAVR